jgi:hypothetical protein
MLLTPRIPIENLDRPIDNCMEIRWPHLQLRFGFGAACATAGKAMPSGARDTRLIL